MKITKVSWKLTGIIWLVYCIGSILHTNMVILDKIIAILIFSITIILGFLAGKESSK